MKTAITAISALLLTLVLTGCDQGNKNGSPEGTAEQQMTETVDQQPAAEAQPAGTQETAPATGEQQSQNAPATDSVQIATASDTDQHSTMKKDEGTSMEGTTGEHTATDATTEQPDDEATTDDSDLSDGTDGE